MRDDTKDFARLYGLVSEQLARLTTAPNWRTQAERDWLAYLTITFQQLFEDWEVDGNLISYLDGLDNYQGHRVHRLFRLAGHVYLHVAYDLVRGVAATLDSTPGVHPAELCVAQPPSKTFMHPARVFINSRPKARLAFLAAAPAFARALESDDALALLGEVTPVARILGVISRRTRRLALLTISQWVLNLRNAAFMTAESIADSPPADRQRLVRTLAQGLTDAVKATPRRSKALDLEPWGIPILGVSPVAFLVDQPWIVTVVLLVLIIASWILRVVRRSSSQKRLLAEIDALGLGVLEALVKVRNEAKDLPEGATRGLTPAPEG